MLRQHTTAVTTGIVLGVLGLLVVTSLLGWGGGDPAPPPEPVEALRTERLLAALTSVPDGLDPHTATSDAATLVLDQVYDTLVRPGPDLLPRPALATDWEVSDDGLTWTFALRDDVTFHDGSPLTSADVVASLARVTGEAAEAGHLTAIDEIEAVDDHTVEIHLDRPTGGLLAHLGSSPRVAIAPQVAVEAGALGTAPAGSGPFRLVGSTEDTLELERFDDHWGGQAPLETISFRIVDNETEALDDLRSDELDWVASVPPDAITDIEEDDDLRLARRAGLEYWHLAFNRDREPFHDRGVRRTLALALDRGRIAAAARPGAATPNHSPAPPTSFWHHDHTPFPHRPDRARERLAEADLDEPALELLVTDELAESDAVAEAIAEQFADVGVDVTVRTESLEDLLVAQAEGDFDAFVLGWRGSLDPDDLYYASHHSEGTRNFHAFVDEDVDELLEEAREEHRPRRRRNLYAAAVEAIVDDAGYAYLFNSDVLRVWSADLEDVEMRADGAVRFDRAHLAR